MDDDFVDFSEDWYKIVDKGMMDYGSLTEPERVWFNVQILMSMVENGGLRSYFCEGTVEHVFDVIEDLKLLGVDDLAATLGKLNCLFPNGRPSDAIEDRMNVMGKHEKLLDDLDEEFFAGDGQLEEKLIAYIIEHKLSS